MNTIEGADDGTLIQAYIRLRDERAARKKAFESDDEQDKAMQKSIEAEFLRRFADRRVENVSSEHGTAYRSARASAKVTNADALLEHARENGDMAMLKIGVSIEDLRQYREANGALPPGIDWSETLVVGVRRK